MGTIILLMSDFQTWSKAGGINMTVWGRPTVKRAMYDGNMRQQFVPGNYKIDYVLYAKVSH